MVSNDRTDTLLGQLLSTDRCQDCDREHSIPKSFQYECLLIVLTSVTCFTACPVSVDFVSRLGA
jgi:hypothetical protein